MDVQDLVLQWVFLRSFEARPQLTTYFIQFLTELLKKYAGANLMMDSEKNILICSCIQLYITCYRYVDASYFSLLFQLTIKQTGCSMFLNMIEWQLKENKIIEEFHMDQILEILQIISGFIPGPDINRFGNLWRILIDFCYSNLTAKQPTTAKCLRFLGIIYLTMPDSIERLFAKHDDQVLIAIKHLAEKENGATPKTKGGQNSAIRNEVIEEPGQDPYDNSDQGDQQDDDKHDVDYDLLSLKGQIDGFLNNFLRADENTAYKYMICVKEWLDEPRMESLLSENANSILSNLVAHLQQICGTIEPYRLKAYLLIVELLSLMADNEQIVKAINDKVCFELFDTMLFILIHANETKSNFKEQSEAHQGLAKLINNLNLTVLKFISNSEHNMIYQTLFDLLIKCRESYVPPKFDGLVVKCIVKITQKMDDIADHLDLPSLLTKMHAYMVLLKEGGVDKKDDIGVKIIKTVLNAVIEKYEDKAVVTAYAGSIAELEHEDNSIKKWMHMILQTKKSKEAGVHRDLNPNRATEKPPRRLGDKSGMSSAYGSNSNLRQKPKVLPPEEPEEEAFEEEEDELAEVRQITEKLKQPSLPLSQLPKILKELEMALSKLEQEINIEPLIADIDDKKKLFILREIKKFYAGDKKSHLEMSETKSRLSHSNMKESSQEKTYDKKARDQEMEAKVRQYSLRHAASSKTMAPPQRDQDSLNTSQMTTPSGPFNRSMRVPREAPEAINEQARKIDELKKRMNNLK